MIGSTDNANVESMYNELMARTNEFPASTTNERVNKKDADRQYIGVDVTKHIEQDNLAIPNSNLLKDKNLISLLTEIESWKPSKGMMTRMANTTYNKSLDSTINKVEKVFPANGMLKGIANVESDGGRNKGVGGGGGIFQVDPIGFKETKNTKTFPKLNRLYGEIKNKFNIDWNNVQYSDLQDPLYGALAARIFLYTKPGAIPTTLEGQAAYWKKHYNTLAGKGTEYDFIKKNRR